ncbi:hypothetical protein L0P88_17310 [Muricauda sp. SCSIO 64092]|uniref:hypothetical protein n=1 Tax=Allomuricauda sp. SCSIO 64092 TaxID=2908842 RepID=UPI001FF1ECFF|nr:hypothetical protein [Muricauda sp. SCSIO 64092]UOY05697.1 hypothetical protein L0P88_17310 [Muricauda sp. SCSIO 64092]
MYRIMLVILLLCSLFEVSAQGMTSEKLLHIIQAEADTVSVQGNSIRFLFNDAMLVCIYDEGANRMRIISPIVEREKLGEEELLNALVANFHSVLDVKYALSDEVIWSVYAHPLKELNEAQVIDAIQQVYAAAITFGKSYSSTNLVFPGNTEKKEKPKAPKILKKT